MEEIQEEIHKEVKGSYKIENIILIDFTFKRKEQIEFSNNIENAIDIITEIGNSDNENQIVVSVILSVNSMQNESEVFSIKIKMTGIFTKEGTPALPEAVFKKINAPAIIYPFMREQVANICLRAGLGNVFLPPVNFVERNK
jgi:preprotein translocase subunit SecB